MSSAVVTSLSTASDEHVAEIEANLKKVREAIQAHSPPGADPLLIAVSTSRPVEDIMICYNLGQRDFGEQDAQELATKAKQVSSLSIWYEGTYSCSFAFFQLSQGAGEIPAPAPDIVWHFLGVLRLEDITELERASIAQKIAP